MAEKRHKKSENGEACLREKKQTATKCMNPREGSRAKRYPVVVVAVFFCLLFVSMIVFLISFVMEREEDMVNHSYNSRQDLILSRNSRGTIYAADGEILAETLTDEIGHETRSYPYGKVFAHVVGYSVNGRMGIEALMNYYLINTNISVNSKVQNDIAGLKNPGDSVYTTLDTKLQQVADRELNIYRGAVLVTEVKTGRVLALVSHPNFEPNTIEDQWESLLSSGRDAILFNRATQGLYPPGSTFKLITSLEYMRQYPEDYANFQFNCTGVYQHGSRKITCYHGTSHGRLDFTKAFAKSCNSAFADIGMSLDKARFSDTLKELLFGRELPFDMVYAKSSAPVDAETSDSEMMQVAIGQGMTQITPLHLHMITGAIANGGTLMKPYVVDRVESVEGKTVKSYSPTAFGNLLSDKEATALTEMMPAVVTEGTAKRLKDLPVQAAGKTGSAEFGNVKGESHAWFTGFAPASDPEIAVTILVEEAGSAGDYAVPMAKAIFETYFSKEKVAEEP